MLSIVLGERMPKDGAVSDRGLERTRRIVATAIALAERDGYEAVRLRDVAAQSEVALGTVYRRFSSKEDILVAALEYELASIQGELAAIVSHETNVSGRVNGIFRILTEHLLERENLARALLRAVTSGSPGVSERVNQFYEVVVDLLAGVMDVEPLAGEDFEALRHELSSIIHSVWFAELVGWGSGIRTSTEVVERTARAGQVVLAGLFAERQPS